MMERWNIFSRWVNWRLALLGLAVTLIVLGASWRGLVQNGSDVGAIDEWVSELKAVYTPRVESGADWPEFTTDFAATAWKWRWQDINAHWDARSLAFVSGLGLALVWAWLCVVLWRVRPGVWMTLLLVGTLAATFTAHELFEFWISSEVARSSFVLATALGLLWGIRGRTGSARWWAGCVIGLIGVVGATEGMVLPVVLLVSELCRSRGRPWRRCGGVACAGVAGVLALTGAALWWWCRRQADDPTAWPTQSFVSLAYAWPQGKVWPWLFLCLPAVWQFFSRSIMSDEETVDTLTALAGWSLLLPWMCAALDRSSGPAMAGILIPVALINAACVAAGLEEKRISTYRQHALAMVWVVGMILLFVRTLPDVWREMELRQRQDSWMEAWRLDDAKGLASALRIDEATSRGLLSAKHDPRWDAVWTTSLRPPRYGTYAPAQGEIAAPFRLGGHPALSGEPAGWPAIGTWRENSNAGPGKFTGETFLVSGNLVRVWLAGAWVPGTVDLVLRTETGRILRPLDSPRPQATGWVRLNIENPGEAARLELTLKDPLGWVALCGPIGAGGWSRIAPKIIATWPWVLSCGFWLGLIAIFPWLHRSLRNWDEVSEQPVGQGSVRYGWVPRYLLAAYVMIVAGSIDTSAVGTDTSAYLNNARIFSEGRLTMTLRPIPQVPVGEFSADILMPLGFAPSVQPGEVAPITAPGFSLMCAGVGCFMPLSWAVAVVIGINLVLGIFFTQRLAAAWGLSWTWSWVAGFMVGLSPVYLHIGLQSMSDVPALTWVTAAVYFAWQSRTRPNMALAAGMATAIAILVRPPNALAVLPVLVCLAGSWRRALFWVLGGIPGAIFQFYFNWKVWGHPLVTGYGDVRDVISWQYVPGTVLFYAQWLPFLLSPLILLFPALPWARRVPWAVRWVLVLWAAVYLGFYAALLYTKIIWWFMRFVLPAFPAVVIGSLLVARECQPFVRRWGWMRAYCRQFLLIAGVILWLLAGIADRKVFYWMDLQSDFVEAGLWLKKNAAPSSTVLAVHGSGTVTYDTDLSVVLYHHDVVRESPAFAQALARGGQEVYALMFSFEWPDARPDFLGEWEQLVAYKHKQVKIWRWLGLKGERKKLNSSGR